MRPALLYTSIISTLWLTKYIHASILSVQKPTVLQSGVSSPIESSGVGSLVLTKQSCSTCEFSILANFHCLLPISTFSASPELPLWNANTVPLVEQDVLTQWSIRRWKLPRLIRHAGHEVKIHTVQLPNHNIGGFRRGRLGITLISCYL